MVSNYQTNNTQIYNNGIIFSLLFLLNPFIAILIGAILFFDSKKSISLNLWLVYVAIWISLININKVPESDEINYIKYYLNVGHESLYNAICEYQGSFKEPIYGLFQTFCYYLYGGNITFFIFTVSFFNYIFLLLSVKIILIASGYGIKAVIMGVICIVFFNQFFYISVHLIRQVMAFSVILYAIALRCNDGKIHWLPTICAPLIHTSAGLFAFLSLIPLIYHKMKFKQYILLSVPIIAISFGSLAFGAYMVSVMGNNNASYAFERLASEANDGLESDPMVIMIMIIPLLTISLISLIRLSKEKNYNSSLYVIIHIFIFLALMVIGLSHQPLLQYRFTFTTYQMLPFIIPLLFSETSKIRNIYFLIVSILFIFRFLITFQYSSWTYNVSAIDIIFLPLPAYL